MQQLFKDTHRNKLTQDDIIFLSSRMIVVFVVFKWILQLNFILEIFQTAVFLWFYYGNLRKLLSRIKGEGSSLFKNKRNLKKYLDLQ